MVRVGRVGGILGVEQRVRARVHGGARPAHPARPRAAVAIDDDSPAAPDERGYQQHFKPSTKHGGTLTPVTDGLEE